MGSADAIKRDAVSEICCRSVQCPDVVYSYYIRDDDSKMIKAIPDSDPCKERKTGSAKKRNV